MDSFSEHGLDFEEWKAKEKEESKKRVNYTETVVDKNMLNSLDYRRKFDELSEDKTLNRTAWKVSKEILNHRSGTRFEDLAFIDSSTGTYLINKGYDVENTAKPSKAMRRMLNKSEPGTIIAIHNHPGSGVPSIPDIRAYIQRGYGKGVVICHDGKIYIYSVDVENYNEPIAASALDWLEIEGYTEEVKRTLDDAGVSLEVL